MNVAEPAWSCAATMVWFRTGISPPSCDVRRVGDVEAGERLAELDAVRMGELEVLPGRFDVERARRSGLSA